MKTSKVVTYNNEKFLIEVEVEEQGRVIAKSPKVNVPPKTPIKKVKKVKNSESVDKPNIVRS